jgi:hypothetical protein
MEGLHQGYLDIMAMPIGRRRRFCDEFENRLKTRANKTGNK